MTPVLHLSQRTSTLAEAAGHAAARRKMRLTWWPLVGQRGGRALGRRAGEEDASLWGCSDVCAAGAELDTFDNRAGAFSGRAGVMGRSGADRAVNGDGGGGRSAATDAVTGRPRDQRGKGGHSLSDSAEDLRGGGGGGSGWPSADGWAGSDGGGLKGDGTGGTCGTGGMTAGAIAPAGDADADGGGGCGGGGGGHRRCFSHLLASRP